MRKFKNYEIWKLGMEIVNLTYDFLETLPRDERYNLISQMAKCSVSIPSNIAEGAGRKTDKEFRRFLEMSLGSSYELETQLLIAQNRDMGNQLLLPPIFEFLEREQKMIVAFMHKLN